MLLPSRHRPLGDGMHFASAEDESRAALEKVLAVTPPGAQSYSEAEADDNEESARARSHQSNGGAAQF